VAGEDNVVRQHYTYVYFLVLRDAKEEAKTIFYLYEQKFNGKGLYCSPSKIADLYDIPSR
jgi:hypothetical protein